MADFAPGKATRLWQLDFEGPWPTAIAFAGPNRIVAGNQRGELFVWNLPDSAAVVEPAPNAEKASSEKKREAPNFAPARKLVGHRNGITRLVSLPDGRHVVSASLDRTLRIWDLDATPTGEAEVVLDSEFRKAEAKRTRKEDLLKQPGVTVATLAPAATLDGHRDWVHALSVSGDGKRLLSGDASAVCIVWDVAERKEVARWNGLRWNWIVATALSPDGKTALVSEYRYKRDDFDIPAAALRLWSVDDGQVKLDLLKVQFPKYNPDDSTYGGGQVWLKFTGVGLVAAAFSPDGRMVAVGQGGETDKGQAHLMDAETGKLIRDVGSHQYGMTDLAFSADGKYLLTAGRDTSIRIGRCEDGQEALALGAPRGGQFKDWISALALSPDQTRVAGADIGGNVHVWRIEAK